ncbi:MAG: hypothetical protein AAF732_07920 [Pseudomonadota bacterium]
MNRKLYIAAVGLVAIHSSLGIGISGALAGDAARDAAEAGSKEPAQAKHKSEKSWFPWFAPIGDRKDVETVSDKYIPFVTEKDKMSSREEVLKEPGAKPKPAKKPANPAGNRAQDGLLPQRPKLMVEAGNGFLDTGKLHSGFEVPFTGAVWQPRLWAYAINRLAFQTFDNGQPGRQRETEIANRLDLFVNLQLTGTEKILLGLRPTDNNEPDLFSRYTFSGANEGFNDEFGFNVETLFFEGDFGSLFPNLDKAGILPIDFGFTVGRQPIVFQEGILINDTIDAVGIIRNNIPFAGTSNFRVSAMWGWNRLDRNDQDNERDENMFGLFIAADAHVSTWNLDLIYVDDEGDADGFYVGIAAIQRLAFLGGISTAFRVNSSFALNEEVEGNVVGDGTLITAELSKTVPGSDDIVYFNSFLGIGNFTQAGREAVVGGPLANTGILFASPNLSTYLAEINPFTNDDVVGGAIGYQAFWDNNRRNLILEAAFKFDLSGNEGDSAGVGFQLQQAVGRHVQLQFEGFYTWNEVGGDASGARMEVQIVY